MTTFADVTGISGIKALKLDSADYWMGLSSNVVAIDTTSACSVVFSCSNWASASVQGSVIDCASTYGNDAANAIGQIVKILHGLGLCSVYYDGTNQA